MNRLPQFSIRHPRSVLAAWLIIVLVSAFFAMFLDSALSGGGFTNPRAEAITTQQTIEHAFHDAPNQVIVAIDSAAPITTTEMQKLTDQLKNLGASTVQGPSENVDWLSTDGKTAVLVAGFPGDNTAVQNLTPTLQAKLSAAVDAQIFVTGQPALDYQLILHSKEDVVRAELIVFPILLIVLLLVFRSVAATIVPLAIAGAALATSNALGYLATQVTDISLLYSNIVTMIGVAVAVDYSLFIIKRHREELASGKDVEHALSTAFSTAGRSVVFSGIAVALALSALLIPNLMAFTSIALGGIFVTLIALLLSMTALPAALRLLGRRIDWGTLRFLRSKKAGVKVKSTFASRLHPRLVSIAGIAAMLFVAIPILGISLQSPVASANILPAGDSTRTGLELIEKNIGHEGLFPLQVVIDAPAADSTTKTLQTLQTLTTAIKEKEGVASVTSLTAIGLTQNELIAALNAPTPDAAVATLWSRDGDRVVTRIIVDPTSGPDSVATHNLVENLRTAAADIAPAGTAVGVTGATAQGTDFDQTLIDSIPWIIGIVFLLTFIMLTIAFKSMILPLLALGFNTLVILTSLGLLASLIQILTSAPMNSVTPILLFAVMFGLSMDYMVIIISRILEAYEGGLEFNDAITLGTRQTRAMINSAALVMVAVFASFMSAQISIVREIGIGLAIAVVLDAVVIRMVVMPAVLRALGPRVLGRSRRRGPNDLPTTGPLGSQIGVKVKEAYVSAP